MNFTFGKEVVRPAFDKPGAALLSYGIPFHEACVKHATQTYAASRVFVIASTGLVAKVDALTKLKHALGPLLVGVHIGIAPHTPLDDCLKILKALRASAADCLITLGAGSLTDGAKLMRFALANDVDTLEDFTTLWGGKRVHNVEKRANVKQSKMPLICAPTSLSGGEYQAIAGATDPISHRKVAFEPDAMPNLVILDPQLCITTPEKVWLSTGVRSIDHCVETACALQCDESTAQDALRGLRRLVAGLLITKKSPNDLSARFGCQLGVVDGMCSRATGVPLGASHGISHSLGPLGVSHGETSCITLPPVCKYNAEKGANVEQQRRVADALLALESVQEVLAKTSLSNANPDLGDILGAIIDTLQMPRTLKAVGIGRDKLDLLALHSLEDPWCKANPFPVTTKEQVLEILESVVE